MPWNPYSDPKEVFVPGETYDADSLNRSFRLATSFRHVTIADVEFDTNDHDIDQWIETGVTLPPDATPHVLLVKHFGANTGWCFEFTDAVDGVSAVSAGDSLGNGEAWMRLVAPGFEDVQLGISANRELMVAAHEYEAFHIEIRCIEETILDDET